MCSRSLLPDQGRGQAVPASDRSGCNESQLRQGMTIQRVMGVNCEHARLWHHCVLSVIIPAGALASHYRTGKSVSRLAIFGNYLTYSRFFAAAFSN